MIFEIFILFGTLFLVAVLCLVLATLIISRKLREQYDRVFSYDITKLKTKADKYRKRHSDYSDEEILDLIIKSESTNAGIIGFFTGLGGLLTLPIALPFDIFVTIRIQYRLTEYILNRNSGPDVGLDVYKAKALAILFGANKVGNMGAKFSISLIVKYAPQVFMKSIPILGGVVGFLIGYFSTRGVAEYTKKESLGAG